LKTGTRVILALWVLGLFNYLDRVVISFAGPSIMASLSMSPAAFGLVLSSFSVGYLLAQIPGGLLTDRFGAKVLLVVGPLLWAVFTGATGLVSTLVGFVMVRFLLGLSEGASQPSGYKTIGGTFGPDQRSRALAICTSAMPLAPLVAGALVGKLVGAFSWQTTFFIMAVPSALVALLNSLLIPAKLPLEHVVDHKKVEKPSFRNVLATPGLFWLCLGSFACNIPYWGFLGWMPSYLSMARHIDLTQSGYLASIPYIFAFLGLLISGWLGSGLFRRHCPQLLVFLWASVGFGLILAYQANSVTLSLVGLSIAAFGMFGGTGPIGKVVLDLAPARGRATFVGVYNTVGHLGGAAAPAAVGTLVKLTGTFAAGFGLMVVGLSVGAVCILLVASLQRRSMVAVPG
jgi:sugar phosphate permease